MKFKIGMQVQLVSFNGETKAPVTIRDCDNFWKLIGERGEVVSCDPLPGISNDRILIRFAHPLDALGLANHNQHSNSLWIKKTDLLI